MDVRKALYKVYWRIRGTIAPTLKYSQYLYEDVLRLHVKPNMKWLDLGCGSHLLPPWRSEEEKHLVERCKMIVGLDYDLRSLREHKNIFLKVRGDITSLPFRDKLFDLVTANMVVEHLASPDIQFLEVGRILKPGGLFIFHTPNVLSYITVMRRLVPNVLKGKLAHLFEGREEADVFETYYSANSRKRIHHLAQTTGFDVVEMKGIVSDALFVIIPPLVILELLWIRILMTKPFEPLRMNIMAILRRRQE